MNSDKYIISFECNVTAKDNLIKLLQYFKMMGDLGCTRDFKVVSDSEYFTFDGDGPDHIKNIKVGKI